MHANNTKSTYVHLTYSDTQKAHLCLSENTYICIVPRTSNGSGDINTRIIMTDKNHYILTFHKPDTSSRQELPVAGGDVKAGFPSPADDFIDSPLDLNREFVHNPSSTFFVRVSGDSMAGDGIGDGDLLIVDKSLAPYDGCIAICFVDGEFTVKRVKMEKSCVWLMPSNPKYKPIRVDAGNDFMVWGIVRHVIKTFK